MMGDKGNFLSLSESKSGNITFGNDARGKIKGKGMVSLRSRFYEKNEMNTDYYQMLNTE
jgi:hypothetical protein